MKSSDNTEFLKNHAKRLREIATAHNTDISPDLLRMAKAIEERLAAQEQEAR